MIKFLSGACVVQLMQIIMILSDWFEMPKNDINCRTILSVLGGNVHLAYMEIKKVQIDSCNPQY